MDPRPPETTPADRTSGPVDLSPEAIERRRRVLARLVATDRRAKAIRARIGGLVGVRTKAPSR